MEVPERVVADVVIVSPVGRIDLANGEVFSERLADAITRHATPAPLVLLDLAGIEYISSIGLRALMMAAKQTKAAGGKIAAANLTPTVAEIFDIARFKFVLPVFADTREALVSLSDAAVLVWDAAARS